jgi:hypothetical protein
MHSCVACQGENLGFDTWLKPVMAMSCVLEGIIDVKPPVPSATLREKP